MARRAVLIEQRRLDAGGEIDDAIVLTELAVDVLLDEEPASALVNVAECTRSSLLEWTCQMIRFVPKSASCVVTSKTVSNTFDRTSKRFSERPSLR